MTAVAASSEGHARGVRALRRAMFGSLTLAVAATVAYVAAPAGITWNLISTSLPTALAMTAAYVCVSRLGSRRGRWLARAGLVCLLPLTLIVLLGSWLDLSGFPLGDAVMDATVPLLVMTASLTHAALLAAVRVRRRHVWLVVGGAAATLCVGAVTTGMMLADSGNRLLFAVLGFLLLAAVCLTVVIALVRRFGGADAQA